MLEKYKVIKENNEEVLYLYLNMNYEFSEELDHQKLEQKTRNWLYNQKISFNGDKVVLVIDGIVSKVMTINNNYPITDQEEMLLEDNKKMILEDILLSLLLTNIKIDLPLETLKCIVILYRSEILKLNEEKKVIKHFNKNFSFIPYDYFKLSYPFTYQRYVDLYKQAIKETKGQYLTYSNKKVEAYMHIASNGYTEADETIPYLIKKESFWDFTYPYYLQIKNFTTEELRQKLGLTQDSYDINIVNISQSNRIKSLQIGSKTLKPIDMSAYLGLASSDATILVKNNGLTFVTRGVGSGLGLSLWGAKSLAELGCNYLQILGYYFQDVKLITP